jgi:hypothetical protein
MIEPREPANNSGNEPLVDSAKHGRKRHRRRIKVRLPADERPKRVRGDSRRYWAVVVELAFVIMCLVAMWIVMGALARPVAG